MSRVRLDNIRGVPGSGDKRLLAEGGGMNAIWSRAGRELFYRRGDEVVSLAVETVPVFSTGKPVALFRGRYRASGRDFDVAPGAERFVMMRSNDSRTTPRLGELLDWWRTLDSRLKAERR